MKATINLTVSFLLTLVLFAFANFAFAQESVPEGAEEDLILNGEPIPTEPTSVETKSLPKSNPERVEELEQKKTEIQENIAEKKETVQEKKTQLEARAQERVINLAANLSNRMDAVIIRIQNIIDRTSERIDKIAEAGIDTTAAESALASAQLSIGAASEEISTIDTDVNEAVTSEDVREAWLEVKTKYQNTRDYIRTAHTELRATIEALKAAAMAASENGASEAVRQDLNKNPDAESEEIGDEDKVTE